MEILQNMDDCVGCGICYTICPTNCITMLSQQDGFLYPKVNIDKCVNCGLCIKKCPINKAMIITKPITAYALKDKITSNRLKSASGGAFGVFAKHILKTGGVCCGVKLNEDLKAVHDICISLEEIDLYRDSKYVQSDMNGVIGKIEFYLSNNQRVLVSGTPCQIAAIRSCFGDYNKNLILCDLICTGVPSPYIFQLYLTLIEDEENKKIEKFYFKDKTNGWEKSNIKIIFTDGSEKIIKRKDSEFFIAFGHNLISRKSCYNCKFKNFNTYSDMTIGDYWGIDEKYKNFNDNKGCSVVIVNTIKGEKFFKEISKFCNIVETGVDYAVKAQPKLKKSIEKSPYRNLFFKTLSKKHTAKNLKKTIKKYTSNNIIYKSIRKILLLRRNKND